MVEVQFLQEQKLSVHPEHKKGHITMPFRSSCAAILLQY